MKTLMAFGCAALCAAATPPMAGAQKPDTTTKKPDTTTKKPGAYAYRYRFLGVYDAATGDPIEGAEVSDVLTGTKALTTKTGTVSLMFLPEGGSLVRIRKVGFEMQTLTVPISPADTTPVTVVLAHATALDPVIVKDSAPKYIAPGLRTFEDHMRQGFGHFVTEDQFRKDDGKPLANILLTRMPGLMRTNGPHGETYLVSSRKPCAGNALTGCRQPNCYPQVIQDGVTLYDITARMPPLDYSKMDGVNFAAAEYYAGGAASPPEYNETKQGCGVLVLWTRER
jgi:hypothetical protein